MATNLAMVPIIARLMGPAEFGISVLGLAALAMAEAVRDFGGTSYIINDKNLSARRVHTAFTIMLVLTLAMTIALLAAAGPIARFYGIEGLQPFIQVTALCYLVGPFVSPLNALLRRDLEFGRVAKITVGSTTVYAVCAIGLASLGHSYMSFAWASLASSITAMVLGFCYRSDLSIFRLSLGEWRLLVGFGRYEASASILMQLRDYLPYLIFGRLLNAEAVGLFQRATTICDLPKRTLLGGLSTLALPAMSACVRDGARLADTYLKAASYVTAVHWPSLALLALLAHPIVAVLLGPKWTEAAPLVQIIAAATLFNFSVSLTFSTLIAAGAVHRVFLMNLILVPASTVIVAFAAQYGLTAVAWSMFIAMPLETAIAMYFLRRSIPFSWLALGRALSPSAKVTALTVAGPSAVIALHGTMHLSVAMGMLAGALGAAGWLAGLRVCGHPLYAEILRLRDDMASRLQSARAAREAR